MGAFRNALNVMFKRPFIIIFPAVLSLVYAVLEYNIPLMRILFRLNEASLGGSLEGMVYFLQIIFNPMVMLTGIGIIAALALVVSLLFGLLLSGYLTVVNNAVKGQQPVKGEFAAGVKRLFSRITFITLRAWIAGCLLVVFLMVVCVPAVIISKSLASGKLHILLAGGLVDLVTAGVVFLGCMFFRIYVAFWYGAAVNNEPRPFSAGKRLADKGFWGIVARFVVFDLAFLIFNIILFYIDRAVQGGSFVLAGAAFTWVFNTFFLAAFASYIMSQYSVLEKE